MVEAWVDAAQAAWCATECRRWRRASAALEEEEASHFELVINVTSMRRLAGRASSPFVRASLHARGGEVGAGAGADAASAAAPAASAAIVLCSAETGRIPGAPEGGAVAAGAAPTAAVAAGAAPTPASQATASSAPLTWSSASGGLLRLAAVVRPRSVYELHLSMWDAAFDGSGDDVCVGATKIDLAAFGAKVRSRRIGYVAALCPDPRLSADAPLFPSFPLSLTLSRPPSLRPPTPSRTATPKLYSRAPSGTRAR